MKRNFKPGQVWLTRNGAKAVIIDVESDDEDIGHDYPIIAYVDALKVTYSAKGNYYCDSDYSEHHFDLINLVAEDEGMAEVRDADHLKLLWAQVYVMEYNTTHSATDAALRARRAIEEFRKEFHDTP